MIVRPVVCRTFIGRQEELAYLHERRREAGAANGGLVLLSGEAGIGKSRLLAEFTGALAKSRWRVGVGRCLEFAQRPYGPILEVLSRFDPSARELPPAASKYELFETVADAFARAAGRSAIVAVIEDVHWADAATLELLAHLGGKLDVMRMLAIVSYRPEESYPDHPTYAGIAKLARAPRAGRVELTSLDGPELRVFIDTALDDIELATDTRRAVARASDGNPFFVEELLTSAVEHRSRGHDADVAALPTTVRATLMERLRPLDEGVRRVLAQAAVIGRSFDLDLLAETLDTDVPALLPALRRVRDLQLVVEVSPNVFQFRHALTREAIYGDFLSAEIRPLHYTIGLVLERVPEEQRSVESLAYHWWAAGDAPRSARYNELAGDTAGHVHAHGDALRYYERALESLGAGTPQRAHLLEKIAERRGTLGYQDAALAASVEAADVFRGLGDHDREAASVVSAAMLRYGLGHPQPTAALHSVLERLVPGEYVARSRVHLGIAWIAATFYDPDEATHHLRQVDPRAIDDVDEIALRFHNVSAWVSMTIGDAAAFRTQHAAWLAMARRIDSVGLVISAHVNGALCCASLGLHEDARLNIECARVRARAEHSRHGEASANAVGALCHLLQGRLQDARIALHKLRSLPTDNGVIATHAMAWGSLVGAHLDDPALIEHWFERFDRTASPFAAALCGAGYAELMVRRGRDEDARALLHRALEIGKRTRGNTLMLIAVARYGGLDDLPQARSILELAADAPTELVERHALMLFDAIVARREGRRDEVAQRAATAAEGFQRLGFRLLEAAARELAGEHDAAVTMYRSCGAIYDLRRLGAACAAGATPPVLEPDVLSVRERAIATLVAEGKSNLEIGHELSISHKTVEKHLGSIYTKLGFSSRPQLGAYASRYGSDRR